jgi:hypothetical protein
MPRTFSKTLLLSLLVGTILTTPGRPISTTRPADDKWWTSVLIKSDPPGAHIYNDRNGNYLGQTSSTAGVPWNLYCEDSYSKKCFNTKGKWRVRAEKTGYEPGYSEFEVTYKHYTRDAAEKDRQTVMVVLQQW